MRQLLHLSFIICFSCNVFAQNVGIGTATPSEKLQVAGNIKADTLKPNAINLSPNAGTGKILTSDATGNATWQASTSISSATGNVGFGVWGDCATNGNISEYNPVADDLGSSGDGFGESVSISGNYAIVGMPKSNGTKGSATIYQYDGANWVMMQKITDATGAANDNFGGSVSISGSYAIIGAEDDDVGLNANQGSASIYQYDGTNWVFMQKITDATGAANDNFGNSVCISGSYAIVGADYDDVGANTDQGSASIYQYERNTWVLMNKITDASGAVGDSFGRSVSISGNYAIVGAVYDDVGANSNQGSASIYQYNGTNWVLMQKINDGDGAANDFFGVSVSISGNYAIIGENQDALGVRTYQGSASIYQYERNAWVLMNKITEANGVAGDGFGGSVCISGNYAIIGAPGNSLDVNKGHASIYMKLGNGWQKFQYVTDPAAIGLDSFGIAVSIDGTTKRFLIGNTLEKAVFGKVN